jgi:predicted transcriptional regulator of viral defense system
LAGYIDDIASNGRLHFTMEEVARALGVSQVAARAAVRRLRQKGRIAMPFRGFGVIVPPEYRRLGCLPAEQFVPQFMVHLGLDYYVGLLSAAEIHGAAHQRPQRFQVVLPSNRRAIRCGKVAVEFVARRNVARIPTIDRNTPRGTVRVATAAATAFDLVGYFHRCGGLHNVATVLAELAESVAGADLVAAAALSPLPWAQRLGHLLDVVDAYAVAEPLADWVARRAREYVPLDPRRSLSSAERSTRWKLLLNLRVEPDR